MSVMRVLGTKGASLQEKIARGSIEDELLNGKARDTGTG